MPCHDPVDFAASLHVHPVVKRAKTLTSASSRKAMEGPPVCLWISDAGQMWVGQLVVQRTNTCEFSMIGFSRFRLSTANQPEIWDATSNMGLLCAFSREGPVQGGSCPQERTLHQGVSLPLNTSGWLATDECQFVDCPDLPLLRSNCSLGF